MKSSLKIALILFICTLQVIRSIHEVETHQKAESSTESSKSNKKLIKKSESKPKGNSLAYEKAHAKKKKIVTKGKKINEKLAIKGKKENKIKKSRPAHKPHRGGNFLKYSIGSRRKSKQDNIDSLGLKVDENVFLTKQPFALSRCDQIVSFQADLIPDLDDYTSRQPANFMITAYNINVFDKTDPAQLIKSILFTSGNKAPESPLGALNCLSIDGGLLDGALMFCLKDDKEFANVSSVISLFEDCRNGGTLGPPLPAPTKNQKFKVPNSLKEAMDDCGMKGPLKSPDELIAAAKSTGDVGEPYWSAAKEKVPGDIPVPDDSRRR